LLQRDDALLLYEFRCTCPADHHADGHGSCVACAAGRSRPAGDRADVASSCAAVACPPASVGANVPAGCSCLPGWRGDITAAGAPLYYVSTCAPHGCAAGERAADAACTGAAADTGVACDLDPTTDPDSGPGCPAGCVYAAAGCAECPAGQLSAAAGGEGVGFTAAVAVAAACADDDATAVATAASLGVTVTGCAHLVATAAACDDATYGETVRSTCPLTCAQSLGVTRCGGGAAAAPCGLCAADHHATTTGCAACAAGRSNAACLDEGISSFYPPKFSLIWRIPIGTTNESDE
jgi:hypothetical protein